MTASKISLESSGFSRLGRYVFFGDYGVIGFQGGDLPQKVLGVDLGLSWVQCTVQHVVHKLTSYVSSTAGDELKFVQSWHFLG